MRKSPNPRLDAVVQGVKREGKLSWPTNLEEHEVRELHNVFQVTIGLAAGIFVLSTVICFTARYHIPVDYGLSAAYAVFFMVIMGVLS